MKEHDEFTEILERLNQPRGRISVVADGHVMMAWRMYGNEPERVAFCTQDGLFLGAFAIMDSPRAVVDHLRQNFGKVRIVK